MRKVVVEVYTSLDGVIQPLDWMPPSETGREERGRYARDQLFASDALLMGRETYEIFANTWPSTYDIVELRIYYEISGSVYYSPLAID